MFKKVKEGLEEFDFIYEKPQDCDNQSQKEKLEADLKKEIKKLQRSREQIKNWMSGSEVKDKKPLIEHRKLIEREMERFKEVEKMMKTKAFSNEALASTTEVVDPKKKEKMEAAEFIEGHIEELQRQIESMEAEIDQISSTLKKKKSDASKQAQINSLQETLTRHKWHITMLESILRHLENDNLDVEQINDIKEDIEYYVESNQDPNFIEDDTFYEMLGLDEMEDSFAVIPGDDLDINGTSNRSYSISDDVDKEKEREAERESEREKEREKIKRAEKETEKEKDKPKDLEKLSKDKISELSGNLSQVNISSPIGKSTTLASTLSASLTSSSGVSNVLLNGGLKPATPVGTPKLKYATAVLSGIKKPIAQTSTPTPVSYASLASAVQNSNHNNNTNHNSTSTPQLSPSQANDNTNANSSSLNSVASSLQPSANGTESSDRDVVASESSGSTEKLYQEIEQLASSNASRILNNSASKTPQISNIQESLLFLNPENYNNLPSGFESYVQSIEAVKNRLFEFKKQEELHVPSKKSQPPAMVCDLKLPPLSEISEHLESSLLNCPDSFDSDKPHNYIPTNPYITQSCFPTDPLPEVMGSRKLLEKVSLDTLFYGFYYSGIRQPSKFTNFHNLEHNPDDDYLQYIMANELHHRGWDYQSNTHTWFSRDELVDSNASDANGNNNWRSFDFRDTWMARRNTDFKYHTGMTENAYFQ